MTLSEYNTTNCEAWKEYWETVDDAERFICPICDKMFPDDAIYYLFGKVQKPVCKGHAVFHETYRVLNELEHELLGDDFNALSVTIKLSEEGII